MKKILINLSWLSKRVLKCSHKVLFLLILSTFFCNYVKSVENNGNAAASDEYIIIQYNVENFFHPSDDSIHSDEDFTEKGKYHWTFNKYYNKRYKICKVICGIAEMRNPLLVSLCEIENEQCLIDICKTMKSFNFDYVHYESKDKRGIDVGLLYDQESFSVIKSQKIDGKIDENYYTRDILMVEGVTWRKDTFFVFVCHLPSKLGGQKNTEWKRDLMFSKMQKIVDSILNINENAKIVILGDMNDKAKNNMNHLENLTASYEQKGTYKYKGVWEMLDQVYVSQSLINKTRYNVYSPQWLIEKDFKFLGDKPKRTHTGLKYNEDGYSDHLPLVVYIKY